jgi:hypothetical protein
MPRLLLKEIKNMSTTSSKSAVPKWFWPAAFFGLAWNIFGIIQFLPTVQGTVDNFMAKGLTKEQAELYVSLPAWMTIAFAVGVFGGTIGSVLLLLRKRLATPMFVASLVAYIGLYIGDITQGVFAAFGSSQVAILTTVVAIAAGLLWVSVTQIKKSNP